MWLLHKFYDIKGIPHNCLCDCYMSSMIEKEPLMIVYVNVTDFYDIKGVYLKIVYANVTDFYDIKGISHNCLCKCYWFLWYKRDLS
jgi:hypothetical protein